MKKLVTLETNRDMLLKHGIQRLYTCSYFLKIKNANRFFWPKQVTAPLNLINLRSKHCRHRAVGSTFSPVRPGGVTVGVAWTLIYSTPLFIMWFNVVKAS